MVGSCISTCGTQRPSRPGSRRLLHVTSGFVSSCERQPFLSKLQPRISIDRVASPCRSLLAVLGLPAKLNYLVPHRVLPRNGQYRLRMSFGKIAKSAPGFHVMG